MAEFPNFGEHCSQMDCNRLGKRIFFVFSSRAIFQIFYQFNVAAVDLCSGEYADYTVYRLFEFECGCLQLFALFIRCA